MVGAAENGVTRANLVQAKTLIKPCYMHVSTVLRHSKHLNTVHFILRRSREKGLITKEHLVTHNYASKFYISVR